MPALPDLFRPYSAEASFALDAVRRAGALCAAIQAEVVGGSLEKDDRSPVTLADFASQAVVARMLAEHFPDDPLVAEEGSELLQQPEQRDALEAVVAYTAHEFSNADPPAVCAWIDRGMGEPAPRFWTLDPIDGTAGFLRSEQYCVALALIEDGEVVVGALACPRLSPGLDPAGLGSGASLIAVRGQGVWSGPMAGDLDRRLTVSQQHDPAGARVLQSVERRHSDVDKMSALRIALGTKADPVRLDSQAKFAVLAGGEAELMFRIPTPARPDYREKIWDQAAGSIVVEEAGGRVTDLTGGRLDFASGRTVPHPRGVLVSNRHLHDAALAAVQELGFGPDGVG